MKMRSSCTMMAFGTRIQTTEVFTTYSESIGVHEPPIRAAEVLLAGTLGTASVGFKASSDDEAADPLLPFVDSSGDGEGVGAREHEGERAAEEQAPRPKGLVTISTALRASQSRLPGSIRISHKWSERLTE